MNLIKNTKAYLGQRSIRTYLKSRKREVKACNIKEAKSIGILFNATHQISFEIVKAFVKDLSAKNKSIDILGYVDSKQLIDHYLYRKGFDFFTQSQLNWYYKPNAPNVEKFIEEPYDLLIDLSLEDPFPIQYIVSCSQAKFKVGRYYEGQESLDFMIDMEKEKEAMDKIQEELDKDVIEKKKNNKEFEKIVDKKAKTEIQMNFLINQLIHYLSLIKK